MEKAEKLEAISRRGRRAAVTVFFLSAIGVGSVLLLGQGAGPVGGTASQPSASAGAAAARPLQYDKGYELPCIEDPQLEFVHIPKNAGTTIENVARTLGYCWGRFNTKGRKQECSSWHLPPRKNPPIFARAGGQLASSFCVVRNPYDRLVSEFRYQTLRASKKKLPERREVWLREQCSEARLNEMVLAHVEEREGWARASRRSNCHLKAQVEYMHPSVSGYAETGGPGGELGCRHWLKIDDGLPGAVAALARRYNLTGPLDIAAAAPSNVRKTVACNLTRASLGKPAARRIAMAYAEDFDRFEFSTAIGRPGGGAPAAAAG